jgi:hypothetical protein
MNEITKSMFESIKSALSKQEGNTSSYRDILKTEVDKTYIVRLLPNIKDPTKTFFHFYQHGWTSFANGKYVSAISPSTFGERDPISELKYKLIRTGTDEEKKKASSIIWSEKWLVNAYVVDDPTHSENNGKIKILQFGKQLYKIIMRAIDGDDADEIGPRVFSLKADGVNLKVVCESQGGYKNYTSSKFTLPKAIDGVTDKNIATILDGVYDLEKVFPVKSYDELKNLLDEHFLCSTDTADSEPIVAAVTEKNTKPSPQPVAAATGSNVDDDEVKRLLDGLDD